MTLTLRAVSLNDQPLTQPITAHFDAKGGTIGRADQSTMALPDPERHISRRQADIIAAADGYRIKNVGSANPILVRGQALGQGESTLLSHRDSVRIGGYLLEVADDDAAGSGAASTITQGRAAVDARSAATPRHPATPTPAAAAGSAGAFSELGAPLSSSNPFADLLGEPAAASAPGIGGPASTPAPRTPAPRTPAPRTPPVQPAPSMPVAAPPARTADPFADLFPASAPAAAAGVPASSAAWGAAPAAPVPRLPDDFDPFAPPPPAAAPAAPAAGSRAGAFEDLIPSAEPASIDELFALGSAQGSASGDPLAAFMESGAVKPGAAELPASADPMAMFAPPAPAAAPEYSRSALADHTPELRGAFRPPGIVVASKPPAAAEPAARAPAPAAPARPAGTGDAQAQALWAAFSEAAGLRMEPPQGLTPELMGVIGTLLRSAVEGTLQLMTVRAATRVELRAQVTMIQARNNNPLKFSPDAQSALEQMLQPPMRGFLTGPAAMTESMNDLVGHSIGTMAGTRAALEGVLDRFGPKELEAKLAGKSMLDSVLPMARKARLWELYLQHFEAIRNEAQEDFQTLFGKAFLAAYEQQLERLRADKKL